MKNTFIVMEEGQEPRYFGGYFQGKPESEKDKMAIHLASENENPFTQVNETLSVFRCQITFNREA